MQIVQNILMVIGALDLFCGLYNVAMESVLDTYKRWQPMWLAGHGKFGFFLIGFFLFPWQDKLNTWWNNKLATSHHGMAA